MTKPTIKQANGIVQMHNIRFYRVEPQEITSMVYNKTQKCLALIR